MKFAVTVDAAAAVRALTERTRPSLAFDVVRVVRRALALGATRIDVECAPDRFTVHWHGAGVDANEIALITRVLTAGSDEDRASALLVLEENHSLALLAILATAERAEVHGACTAASSRGRLLPPPPRSATSSVVVFRQADPASERREIAMWCKHADAPVYVDGKRIDRPFRASGVRLVRRVRGPEGRALVGLATNPASSSVVIYSHGVYLAVSKRPRGSVPLLAHVSVRGFGPEDDTVAARRAAEVVVNAAERALVRGICEAFPSLSSVDRRAVREALLDTDGAQWRAPLDEVPLFDAVNAPFSISLAALRRAGVIHATAYERGHLPGTPLLDVRTRNFVERALGDVVRPAPPSRAAFLARLLGRPRLSLAGLDPA